MIILILFTAFAASGQLEATEAAKEGNFRETRIDIWYISMYLKVQLTYNMYCKKQIYISPCKVNL